MQGIGIGKVCSTVRNRSLRDLHPPALALLLILLIVPCGRAQQTSAPEPATPLRDAPTAGVEDEGFGLQLGTGALLGAIWRHGSFDRYRESIAPGLRLSHYTAGLEWDLIDRPRARWKVVANLAVGASRLRSRDESGFDEVTGRPLSEIFLSLHAGLMFRYSVAGYCDLFVGARDYVPLGDRLGRDVYESLDQGRNALESALRTFPLTAGLRFNLR